MKELDEFIKQHKKNAEKSSDFNTYLFQLIDERGYKKDSDLYKKANISRQNWHKLISNESEPSLKTVLKLVFALELNNHECKYLLKTAGITLSSSSTYSLIIRYCIENKIYDLIKVNDLLEEYGFSDDLIY